MSGEDGSNIKEENGMTLLKKIRGYTSPHRLNSTDPVNMMTTLLPLLDIEMWVEDQNDGD